MPIKKVSPNGGRYFIRILEKSARQLFNHAVEAHATVEGVLDVAEGNALTLVVSLDAVLVDTIFLDKEALHLVGTTLGELHVVLVRSAVVSKADSENLDIGIVLHDAGDSFDFLHLVFRHLPDVNIVEHREGQCVEVQLVGLDLIDNGLEAVGSSAVASATLATLGEGASPLMS